MYINSINPHNNPTSLVLSLSPFCKWVMQDIERLNNLDKVKKLLSNKARIWIKLDLRAWDPNQMHTVFVNQKCKYKQWFTAFHLVNW